MSVALRSAPATRLCRLAPFALACALALVFGCEPDLQAGTDTPGYVEPGTGTTALGDDADDEGAAQPEATEPAEAPSTVAQAQPGAATQPGVDAGGAPPPSAGAPALPTAENASGCPYGWQLMTEDEMAAHRARMRASTTPEERERVRSEHRAMMQQRAQQRGVDVPAEQGGCPHAGMGPGRGGMGPGPGGVRMGPGGGMGPGAGMGPGGMGPGGMRGGPAPGGGAGTPGGMGPGPGASPGAGTDPGGAAPEPAAPPQASAPDPTPTP